ncbi:MAG: hypothetical protein SGBAC_001423 [Bacillariaceae sp.]
MTSHGDFKWMVSIADETFSIRNGSKSDLVELKDPSTKESRQYVQLASNDLVEIQSLESDFASFLVGRHVVKDGSLYVLNRVDPLFWLFTHYSPTEQSKQWRPVDQVVECLPNEIQKALNTDQLPHLFEVLNSEAIGDTPFFKFVPERALKWLQQKHERIFKCLEKQEKAKREQSKKKLSKSSRGGGSVSSSFYMPEDTVASAPQQTETDPTIMSDTDIQRLKLDSAQIINSYLPAEWSKPVLDHLGLTEIEVKATQEVRKPVVSPAASPDKSNDEPVKPKKKVVKAQTIGNKRLAKVNTKGMKSLSSFFGAPSSKKKKVQ